MCCALIALCIAVVTAVRAGLKTVLARRLRVAAFAVTVIAVVVGSAFAAEHVRHYLDRAANNERSVLAEIMAQPICSGSNTANPKPMQLSYADHEKKPGKTVEFQNAY